MKYDVILFTDITERFYPIKPLGAYRIASELRLQGYTVKVINHFASWLAQPRKLDQLLQSILGSNTLFIGVSGTFYNPIGLRSFYQDTGGRPTLKNDSSFNERLAFKLVYQRVKKSNPNTKWVLGGTTEEFVLNSYPEKFDYMVLGLADRSVIELADHIKNKTPIKYMPHPTGCKIIGHDPLAQGFDFANSSVTFEPEDHVLPGEVLPFETSRGCLFKCDFCSYPLLGRKKGDPEYHKTVDSIAYEFERNLNLFGTNRYQFVDDTFNESTKKIEDLLRARDKSKVNINFASYIRLDLVDRFPEQIELLKDLGIQGADCGIESLYAASAKSIGKSSRPERTKEVLYKIRESWRGQAGLVGLFIIGLPHDTPETVNSWMQWVEDPDCPLDDVFLSPLDLKPSKFPSLITANPEKYGYTVDPNNQNSWTNEHWSQDDAIKFANETIQRFRANNRPRLGGWELLNMHNVGYTLPELLNQDQTSFKGMHEFANEELISRKNQKINEYIDAVLAYEQQK